MRPFIAWFAAFALGACASTPAPYRPLRPLALATMPYQWTSTTAATGSLLYEGGCLLFHDEDGSRLFLPVWPSGSSFNGEAVTMHTPGKTDQPVQVAQEVVLSGQTLALPLPPELAPFEHQCGAPPMAVVAVKPAD
jgi:hypothetical protein